MEDRTKFLEDKIIKQRDLLNAKDKKIDELQKQLMKSSKLKKLNLEISIEKALDSFERKEIDKKYTLAKMLIIIDNLRWGLDGFSLEKVIE